MMQLFNKDRITHQVDIFISLKVLLQQLKVLII